MEAKGMCIRLEGLKFFAHHGVLPQEALVGAEFTVDLCLYTDYSRAAETDELDGTINYATVFACVKDEMGTPSRLLEHVSFRISRRLLDEFPALTCVSIRLFKQNPPMGADCKRIGVEATYYR